MMNCMIAGVGGQGTVLASKLIAAAAMAHGLSVRTTETIGMAQRGGSVVSHIRMGGVIHSPLIPLGGADAVVAFEPAEAVRLLPYLADCGQLLVCDSAVKPVTAALSGEAYRAADMTAYLEAHVDRLTVVSGERLLRECRNAKTLNVALLGAAAEAGLFPFGADALKKAVTELLPSRHWEMNLHSFEIGRNLCHAK